MPAEVLSVRSERFTARIVWRRLQVPDISPADDLVRDAQRVARGADDPVPEPVPFHSAHDVPNVPRPVPDPGAPSAARWATQCW